MTEKKVPPGDDPDGTTEHDDDHASQSQCTDDMVAKGKAIAQSGKHLPPRGKHLGRLQFWGIDVFEGSPQEWKDALLNEIRGKPC